MIDIRTSKDLQDVLAGPLHPRLRQLLSLRRDQLAARCDLSEVARFLVVVRGDTLTEIEAAVGLPIAGDESAIEWAQKHRGHWIEAVIVTSDDHATAIFAPDCISIDAKLLLALLAHA